ncbi:MAG: hypothetical protein IKI63_05865, partial [Clostridia bacterium]|nr:hypothetical protein [Clostridia bacterium]
MARFSVKSIGVLLLVFLALLQPISAFAETSAAPESWLEDQWSASGADRLWEELPDSTRDLLDELGLQRFDLSSFTALQPNSLWNTLWDVAAEQSAPAVRVSGTVLGALLLCSLLDGLRRLTDEPAMSDVFRMVGLLAVGVALMVPLCDCLKGAGDAVDGALIFMGSFVPVYAAVLATNGQMSSALSYQTVVLFVSEGMTLLMQQLITPLLSVSLGLGTVGGLGTEWKLDAISGFLNKLCSWLTGLCCTIFVGMLSLQTLVGSSTDGVAIRAVRFSVVNLVPVVGSSISEAFGTIQNCLQVLRTTLGAFGVLATAVLLLPSLLACGWWVLLLNMCASASDVLDFSALSRMLRTAAGVVKTMTAVLISCGLFLIMAATVVTLAGGG